MNYNQQFYYNPSTVCERCGFDTGSTSKVCLNCNTSKLTEYELNRKTMKNINILELLSDIIFTLTIVLSIILLILLVGYNAVGIIPVISVIISGFTSAALLKFCSLTLIYLKKIARK